MKIEQLLMQPVGQKIGGFTLHIKTYKKTWQVGKVWFQQIVCMDRTGEMPVDVKIGPKYNSLRGRATEIHVIVAEVQEAEYLGKDRKKLVVDQFTTPPGITADELSFNEEVWKDENERKIRGMVRHGIITKAIGNGQIIVARDNVLDKAFIKELEDLIVS